MRSLLFIPADSPKKLQKGLSSAADALILDLEDSVATDRKADARAIALAFLKEASASSLRPRLIVRVNSLDTGLTDDDLDGVVAGAPDAIMLPKAEGGPAVIHLDAKLTAREAVHGIAHGHTEIIALATETAASLFAAGSYRGASARLTGLTWGAEDLSADLGAEANRDQDGRFTSPYVMARNLCLFAAASAGAQAIDTVHIDFRNEAGLREEAEAARRDGFTAKMAIHPAQVPIINEVFTPTADAIARAKTIIAAFAADRDTGVVGIGGVMYDRAHVARAERLLARAKAAGLG